MNEWLNCCTSHQPHWYLGSKLRHIPQFPAISWHLNKLIFLYFYMTNIHEYQCTVFNKSTLILSTVPLYGYINIYVDVPTNEYMNIYVNVPVYEYINIYVNVPVHEYICKCTCIWGHESICT